MKRLLVCGGGDKYKFLATTELVHRLFLYLITLAKYKKIRLELTTHKGNTESESIVLPFLVKLFQQPISPSKIEKTRATMMAASSSPSKATTGGKTMIRGHHIIVG